MRSACTVFVGKSEGNRPLGRPRRRWEGNVIFEVFKAVRMMMMFTWVLAPCRLLGRR
jgi:hypothetical protein